MRGIFSNNIVLCHRVMGPRLRYCSSILSFPLPGWGTLPSDSVAYYKMQSPGELFFKAAKKIVPCRCHSAKQKQQLKPKTVEKQGVTLARVSPMSAEIKGPQNRPA